jgi:hypothetical protein
MKKNLIIILLAAGLLFVLYLLLSQGKDHDSHKDDYDLVKADNKILQASRKAGLHIIDSLQFAISQRDLVVSQLEESLNDTRQDLDKSAAKAVQLAKEIKALQRPDTSLLENKCDSLAIEVENLAFLYNAYKSYVDTLTATTNKSLADYRIALNEHKKLYDELQAKYDQLYRLYDVLYKDYGAGQKSLKHERLKTKIAALLALIGGAAAVVK